MVVVNSNKNDAYNEFWLELDNENEMCLAFKYVWESSIGGDSGVLYQSREEAVECAKTALRLFGER